MQKKAKLSSPAYNRYRICLCTSRNHQKVLARGVGKVKLPGIGEEERMKWDSPEWK